MADTGHPHGRKPPPNGPAPGLPLAAGRYDFPVDLGDLASAAGLIARHVPAGAAVLDIGCASGNLLAALRDDRGCSAVGLELDPDAVAAARARGLEVHRTDLTREPLPHHLAGRRFDRVILADVLEHLVEPEQVLSQVPGLLAPGGRVVVSVPNITHFDVVLALAQDRFDYTETGLLDGTHLRFFTLATFGALAQRCGLHVTDVARHIAPPLQTELWRGRADLPPRYLAMFEQAVRAGNPNADVYQFVCVLTPGPPPPSAAAGTAGGPSQRAGITVLVRAPAGWVLPPQPPEHEVVTLDPGSPFGPALRDALERATGELVTFWGPAGHLDPAALRECRTALTADPSLVAVCSPLDQAVVEGLPITRLDPARVVAAPLLPLEAVVCRLDALRLAVQSVATLGAPFLADLSDWTVLARLAQWGDIGLAAMAGSDAAVRAGSSPGQTGMALPLAIALLLRPTSAAELLDRMPAPVPPASPDPGPDGRADRGAGRTGRRWPRLPRRTR